MDEPNKEVRKLKKDKSVSHGAYVTLPKLEVEVQKKAAEKKPEETEPKGFQKLNKDIDSKSRKFATSRPKKESEEPEEKKPAKDPFLQVVISSDEEEVETSAKDGVERRPFNPGKQKPKEGDLENFVSAFPKIPDRLIFTSIEKDKPNVFDAKTMKLPSRQIAPRDDSFKSFGSAQSVPLNALRPSNTTVRFNTSGFNSMPHSSPAATNNLTWSKMSSQQMSPAFGAPRPFGKAGTNNPRNNRSYTLPTIFPEPLTYETSHISRQSGSSMQLPQLSGQMPASQSWRQGFGGNQGFGASQSFGNNRGFGGSQNFGTNQGFGGNQASARFNTPPSSLPSGMYGPRSQNSGAMTPYAMGGSPYSYGSPSSSFSQRYPSPNPYQMPFGRFPQQPYANPYMPYMPAYASRYQIPPGPNRAAQSRGFQIPPGPNRAAQNREEESKPLLDDQAIEESTILDKPPVSIEEGMKTADKERLKKRNGLILTMIAMLVVIGVGYLTYTNQLDLGSMFGIGANSDQADDQESSSSSSRSTSSSRTSSSSSSSASTSAGSVVYQYTALTADGTTYSVEEMVTFAADGTCEFTTMKMEFPDEASAKSYVDSLSNDYGSKLTVDSMDGANATVTIDNSALHLDREEYENTLRYSVQDLVILRK